jgi:hypothetical protein
LLVGPAALLTVTSASEVEVIVALFPGIGGAWLLAKAPARGAAPADAVQRAFTDARTTWLAHATAAGIEGVARITRERVHETGRQLVLLDDVSAIAIAPRSAAVIRTALERARLALARRHGRVAVDGPIALALVAVLATVLGTNVDVAEFEAAGGLDIAFGRRAIAVLGTIQFSGESSAAIVEALVFTGQAVLAVGLADRHQPTCCDTRYVELRTDHAW